MTPLEKALAEGVDVTDTPLGRALRAGGEKVGSERKPHVTMPTHMSRDPARVGQPESVQEEDERLGLDTGPVKTLRVPGVGGIVEGEPAPVGTAARQQWLDETINGVQDVEGALGTAGAGAALGGIAKGAVAAKNIGATGRAAALIEKAIENSFAHGGRWGTLAKIFPEATNAVIKTTTQTLPGAVRTGAAISAGAGATVTPQLERQAVSGDGTVSNAIERLRASAAGNPRAAELMAKIDAARTLPQTPQFPADSGTGAVTQSTLGGTP